MMHPALAPQTTAVSTPLSILVGQLFSDESRSASAPHLYKIPDITNPNRNLLGGSTGLRHLHPLQLTSAVLGIATATEEFSSMMATKIILRRAKSFLSINLGRRLRPRTSSTLASTLLCGTGVTCTDFGGEGTGRKSYFPLLTFPSFGTEFHMAIDSEPAPCCRKSQTKLGKSGFSPACTRS